MHSVGFDNEYLSGKYIDFGIWLHEPEVDDETTLLSAIDQSGQVSSDSRHHCRQVLQTNTRIPDKAPGRRHYQSVVRTRNPGSCKIGPYDQPKYRVSMLPATRQAGHAVPLRSALAQAELIAAVPVHSVAQRNTPAYRSPAGNPRQGSHRRECRPSVLAWPAR